MSDSNNFKEKLDGYLQGLQEKLKTLDVIELRFEDFIEYLPYYEGNFEIDKDAISYLSRKFKEHYLDSEPRIRTGVIRRAIDSPIILFNGDGSLSYKSSGYRNGLLMVRMAVIMSKVDGKIAKDEITAIKKLIWDMSFLSLMEKRGLYAKAIYFISSGQKYDERARDYIRAALCRDTLIKKIPELSSGSAKRIIEISKCIAVADGFLERSELSLLQDMYRALGLPVRSAKSDLEKCAADKYIQIKSRDKKDLVSEKELDEMDDILGDLLLDFNDF